MRRLVTAAAVITVWSSAAWASPMFAVLPIDVRNTGGKMDAAAVASLEEMLRDSASNALTPSGWKVLTGENMLQVLADNGIDPAKCGEASCHVNAAREIKVDWFISGSVQFVDGKFTASIRLLESHAGQILATANLTGTTTTDLKAAFQKQAADFFSRAGIVAGPQGEDQKTGDLFLRVDPPDATYQLDDDAPVPLLPGHNTILALPLGRHRLVVKKSGFQDSRRDIFIDRGKVQTVEITLLTPPPPASPKPGHAYLTVDSTPPQAHIFLDGQDTGKLSPATFSALDAGQHQVVLQRDLYRDTQQRFTLTGDEVKLLKVNLTPNFGGLSIETEPPGATVTVDGKQQSDLTPLTREKWEAKAYRVRLSLPQYETVERTVVIPPGETATVKESLKPTFGTLTIRTKPDGATVYLDDVQLTETTPTTREHLGARTYRLRITAPLYADLNKAVTVERGKITIIDENLHPTFGQIAVAATVNGQPLDGADVLIEGQSRGVTPLTLDRVPQGSTSVEVRAPLHRAWTSKILVQAEQTVHVAAVLIPEYGTVRPKSKPAASFVVDGKAMGPADGRDYRVAMGSRHIAIVPDDAARYRPNESDVVVEVGSTIPIDANLAPRLGSIVVQSVPPGASIRQDGESVGMTPKRLADLFVGTYKLELNAEKFVPWTQDVAVKEGETIAVNAELKSVDLVAYESEQRHQHMVRVTIGGSIGLASAIASGIAAGLSYSYNGQRQSAVNTFDTTTVVATLNSARAAVNSTSGAIRTCEIVSIVTGVLAVAGITWAGIDFFTAPAEPSAH